MAETNIQSFLGQVKVASTLTANTFNFTGTILRNGEEFISTPWDMIDNHVAYTTGNVAMCTTNTSHANLTVGGGVIRLTDDEVEANAYINLVQEDYGHPTNTRKFSKYSFSSYNATTRFGWSVSLDGGTLVVGAPRGPPYRGGVYVLTDATLPGEGTKWTPLSRYQSVDLVSYDIFGYSVSIDGDTFVVGTPADPHTVTGVFGPSSRYHTHGSAYVYTRNTPGDLTSGWTQFAKLTLDEYDYGFDELRSTKRFGHSVSISSDTLVVGAVNENSGKGAAYVYTRGTAGDLTSSWSQIAQLTDNTGGGPIDQFGQSVSIRGDTLVVGAPYAFPSFEGAAYVYTRDTAGDLTSGWTKVARLIASDGIGGEGWFGESVAIDGDTIVIGSRWDGAAPGDDEYRGAAYVYTRDTPGDLTSTWSPIAKLTASDGDSLHHFSRCVAIYGDMIVISNDIGEVYIFTRDTAGDLTSGWTEDKKLTLDAGGFSGGNIGNQNISIDPRADKYNNIAVGIRQTSLGGEVHMFTRDPYLTVSTDIYVIGGRTLSFTGQHLCFPEGPIGPGLIVSANKNKFMNLNGPLTTGFDAIKSSESLPIVSLSNVVNDPTVFGVVDGVEKVGRERRQTRDGCVVKSDKELGDNRVIVNSLGEGAMWVVNTNGNLLSGDYITTSNISGYGHKQDDDILHSYTVAKITMDCDFSPEDIPIQVIKKDENGANILDEYDRLQWEDTDNTKKAYKIKNLSAEDDSNTVWTAAYVGCTYHCG